MSFSSDIILSSLRGPEDDEPPAAATAGWVMVVGRLLLMGGNGNLGGCWMMEDGRVCNDGCNGCMECNMDVDN